MTHNASSRKIRKSLTLSVATYIVGVNDSKYMEDQNCFSCDSQVSILAKSSRIEHPQKFFLLIYRKQKWSYKVKFLSLIDCLNFSLKIPLYFLRVSYGDFHLCIQNCTKK